MTTQKRVVRLSDDFGLMGRFSEDEQAARHRLIYCDKSLKPIFEEHGSDSYRDLSPKARAEIVLKVSDAIGLALALDDAAKVARFLHYGMGFHYEATHGFVARTLMRVVLSEILERIEEPPTRREWCVFVVSMVYHCGVQGARRAVESSKWAKLGFPGPEEVDAERGAS